MATFNVVVSDPASGYSETREVEGQDANRFLGRDIGDEVDGSAVGLDGFTLEITGGSDAAGRPLRPDVRGSALKEILLTGGTGYHPTRDGERKRVTVRGREISEAVAQINVTVAAGDGDPLVALGVKEPEETDGEADEPAEADEAADEDGAEEADAEEEAAAEDEGATEEDEEADAEEETDEDEPDAEEGAEDETEDGDAAEETDESAEAEDADEDADEDDAEAHEDADEDDEE